MGIGKRLGTGVGNGGWQQGLATYIGKKRKGTRIEGGLKKELETGVGNRVMEQSLETRIGNRGREKDWEQGLGTEVGKRSQETKTLK